MEKLLVNTTSLTYPIYFESDFNGLTDAILSLKKTYSSFAVITDTNVNSLYATHVKSNLLNFEKPVLIVEFPAGESSKTLQTIEQFYQQLIEFGADRKTLVVALGGGVTGDMAGFTAATFMRGIDFIQIPTSLLAQVDSSIGGKTGIDFNGYKNIVGAFYQPQFVYINVSTLHTLPEREYFAGMSEIIKHALIKDKDYFDFLKQHVNDILLLNQKLLKKMIYWSCLIKKSVVDEDEKEQGSRALLNFGHTLGHAIERLKEFEYVHGECVSIGMHGALLLSNRMGFLSKEDLSEGLELITSYHLPLYVTKLDNQTLYQEMFHDKKTMNSKLVFVLLNGLGESFLSQTILNEAMIKSCIDDILK